MSINSVTAMDVDSPTGANSLKRSSSAPMINDINNTIMTTSPSTNSASRDSNSFNVFSNVQPRTRRFSASFSPVPGSPTLGPRLAPRISQIRLEECVEREVAHERDVHCQMQMSQSCEDLTLMNESLSLKNDTDLKTSSKDCKLMPLHLNLGSCQSLCSSPSPTRPGYSFSPAGSQIWKPTALSPSPSRNQSYCTRRSLSPILIRQSPLGTIGSVKRKLDDEKLDTYASPRAKRFNSYNPNEHRGLLMAHNNTSSPLPGSLSSVGTPESLSSADSPSFTFRPVDSPSPNRPMQSGTDEPMHEERTNQGSPPKLDQIMTSVDQSPRVGSYSNPAKTCTTIPIETHNILLERSL